MNYQEFKEAVLKAAGEKGLIDYELYYESLENTEVSTYEDAIDSFAVKESGGACFRCIYGGKAGYAATELFTKEAAAQLVESAMKNADVIESEDPVILKEKGDAYQTCEIPESGLPDGTKLKEIALKLQKLVFGEEERVSQASQTQAIVEKSERAIVNSKGLDLSHSVCEGLLYTAAIIAEGEEMYDGDEIYVGDVSKADLTAIAKKAVSDAVSKIGADTVESKKYPCIFSGKMMATLLQTFSQIFYADTAQHGLSLLKGKEGELIASPKVNLLDDPFYAGSSLQFPFDAEGAATFPKSVIENGVFQTFLHNLTTAGKDGKKTTGNAGRPGYASPICVMPYHFYIKPGELSQEQIMEKAGNGLYITELNGMHSGANPITGDFSLEASGYLVEDGKKTKAVHSFTVSDNIYEVLKKIEEVGTDLEFGIPRGQSVFGAPSTLVKDVSVAGK